MPLPEVSTSQKEELATSYACMILSDCESKVNDENINKLRKFESTGLGNW